MEAVLDTNTLASSAVARVGTIAAINNAWRSGDLRVVVSLPIVRELERTLHKPYFVRRLDQQTRDEFLNLVRTTAIMVTITTPVPTVLRTRADNLVLATVESGGVPYVVSGDRELQELAQYRDITMLSPRRFPEFLAREG